MSSTDSKVDVLLVRPRYGKTLSRHASLMTEPLDLEYLASVASGEGYTYHIHDPAVSGENFMDLLETVSPKVVAITGYYPARDSMLNYAERAKVFSREIVTIVGGVHAEINECDFYVDTVDIVVSSGGVDTFRAFLRELREGARWAGLAGVSYCSENGEWIRNEKRALGVSTIPHPERDHFYQYMHRFTYLHYGPVALVKSAYGCPFSCRFCYCRLLNEGGYTARPLEDVVSEIKSIRCGRIWIVDDTFLFDMERARAFVTQLEKQGVEKEFIIYCRAEFIAENPAVVPLLKRAGVISVIVGFESIREERLQDYDKQVTKDQSRRAVMLLREGLIECTGLFIMDLSSTHADFRDLSRWIRSVGLTTYTLSVFTPFPGTVSFDVHRGKLVTSDCRKWDLLHLVMKPTGMMRPTFYLLLLWMHLKMLLKNRNLRNHFLFPKRYSAGDGQL